MRYTVILLHTQYFEIGDGICTDDMFMFQYVPFMHQLKSFNHAFTLIITSEYSKIVRIFDVCVCVIGGCILVIITALYWISKYVTRMNVVIDEATTVIFASLKL